MLGMRAEMKGLSFVVILKRDVMGDGQAGWECAQRPRPGKCMALGV